MRWRWRWRCDAMRCDAMRCDGDEMATVLCRAACASRRSAPFSAHEVFSPCLQLSLVVSRRSARSAVCFIYFIMMVSMRLRSSPIIMYFQILLLYLPQSSIVLTYLVDHLSSSFLCFRRRNFLEFVDLFDCCFDLRLR